MKVNKHIQTLPMNLLVMMIIAFLSSHQLQAQVVTGTDTLSKIDGQWQYYDFTSSTAFSIGDTATYAPDFWGSSNEGVNFGKEFSAIIPSKRLYLLGDGNIDTVKTVPTWTDSAPWVDTSWDFTNGTKGQPISAGQLWVVYTSEGLYAVMQIDTLPDGNFGNSFTFKFKYMSEGGTTLEETNLNTNAQIAGSGTSNSGAGFDFSRQETGGLTDSGDYTLDFAFVNNEGVNFGNESSTSLTTTGRRFILMGTGNIDSVTSVPSRVDASPWVTVSYDFSDGTGGQPVSAGQLWGVYTREGHYAVIEITALPGGNFGTSFDFKYKYQPDGTRFFDGAEIVEPDPVLSIAIESGDNQMVLPEAVAPEFLKVLITDENEDPVSNAEVNFRFTQEPSGILVAGSLNSNTSSNESGIAQTFVTAGDLPGTYEIRAELQADTTKFVTFTLIAQDTTTNSGEIISGSSTSTSGSGFDFSKQESGGLTDSGDYILDFAFVNNEGVNFGNESSTSLATTGRRFLLLGDGSIDSITSVPERMDAAPWVTVSYDFSDGTGGQPISTGQLWGVFTREGHYAVIEITALPGGNFGTSFDFKYKYQPNGTRFFDGDTSGNENLPPEPVALLEIRDGFQSNSLIPEWNKSTSEDFLYYKVYASTAGGELTFVDSTRVGPGFVEDTSLVISELTNLQEYTFAVTVVNSGLLESELSNQMTGFPKPFPSAPQNFTALSGDGTIQLTWNPLDTAYFDFYELFVRDNEELLIVRDSIFSATDTSYILNGLENGALYHMVLNAENRFGKIGEASFTRGVPVASFQEEEEIMIPSLVNGITTWGDVDNDGDLDLLMTGQVNEESSPVTLLYLNDGSGEFINSNQSLIGMINNSAFWFDIDQNGFIDLILSGDTGESTSTSIYFNENGILVESEISIPGYENGLLSPADFDNDGDLDLLVAGESENTPLTILLENDGNQNFVPVDFSFTGYKDAAAAWGDFNNDGKLDFIISGENEAGSISTTLYTNLGDEDFSAQQATIQGVVNGTLAFSDFDLDGDLDLLVTGYSNLERTNQFTGIYIYNGSGYDLLYSSISDPSKAIANSFTKSGALIGDYDNDGDQDVLISSSSSTSILKNNRGSIDEEKLEVSGSSITWADYDGDGDLDIIVTGGTTATVLSNNTAIKNTAPTVPENAMASIVLDSVILSWDTANDEQTPSNLLTYNIRVGTTSGSSDILASNADPTTGALRILANGNAGSKTQFVLRDLPNGIYFWQVQSVDNSFLGSKFNPEQQFEISESMVSNETHEAIPGKVELQQNYPNPFNPSTSIEYSVPRTGLVTLQVFDISGRLIQTLINEQKSTGTYSVYFNASNLASGLYIYRLRVGSNIITKKMTLIK